MRRFVVGEVSFDELVSWVDGHDLSWGTFAVDSLADKLSIAVMHALWDKEYAGDYPEREIRERIAEDLAAIVGTRALP
jgi:hypothetical protein